MLKETGIGIGNTRSAPGTKSAQLLSSKHSGAEVESDGAKARAVQEAKARWGGQVVSWQMLTAESC